MRQAIIHYHIFKNAGSTIDSILKHNFKNGFASIDSDDPSGTLDAQYVVEYLHGHPKVKVLSSHQCRLPVPVSSTINFHPILFLRHPIDRVGSVYHFEKKQPQAEEALHVRVARENDLAGYVKWRLAENNGSVIRNFQTVFLSGREKNMRTARANRADLSVALERLGVLVFFGIVERFDESIKWMAAHLSPVFGRINTAYNIQNKSLGRKNTLEERLEDVKNDLGPALYDELIEKNSLDLELYEAALGMFNEREMK